MLRPRPNITLYPGLRTPPPSFPFRPATPEGLELRLWGWGGVGMIAKASRLQSDSPPHHPTGSGATKRVCVPFGSRPGVDGRLGPVDPWGDCSGRAATACPPPASMRQPQVSLQALLPGEAGGPLPPIPPAPFLSCPPPLPGRPSGQVLPGRDGGTAPAAPASSPRTSSRVPLTRGKKGISQFQ